MKRVLLLSAVNMNLLLLICSSGRAGDDSPAQNRLTQNQVQTARAARTYDVMVESTPPGSLITVNHNACGRAPCRVRITPGRNDVIEIKAIPIIAGQFARSQFFADGAIPNRLKFDTRVPPPDPAIDVIFY